MDPQPRRADSGPNEAAVFSRVNHVAFPNDFTVSQQPQSPTIATVYTPGTPGLSPVSDTLVMPNVNAHLTNLKLFRLLQDCLSNANDLTYYVSSANKLVLWMRREQAFYDGAKPFIVHFLELAQTTLCRACRINPTLKHPFHISQCPREADTLLEAYMSLVQAVRNYEYKFVEPDYRSRLAAVFRTVDPIPNRPPPVPIASSSHAIPAPITTQYAPPPSICSPSTPKVASQFTYAGISPSVGSPSTPLYGNTFGNMIPRPVQSTGLTPVVPSLPPTPPIAGPSKPPSRPSSVAQAQLFTPPPPLSTSAPPLGSPSVMSATASTPSPSLSSISTGQPKPKPKSKAKKKLSVFAGAVDFMNSDLEWFAKHKAKDAEVKQEGAVEKIAQLRTREEPKVEEEGQLGKEDALKAMEERGTDSGEKSAEGEMETVSIKKDTREGGTDTPALSARFEASAKDSNAMQQDSEAQVESEMKKDRPAPEGEEPEGTGDEQDHVDEEQMDVVTDDGESDKVEQILVHDIDYECEKLTEQITVGESHEVDDDKGAALQVASSPEAVVMDAQQRIEHNAAQPMDVDGPGISTEHLETRKPEQVIQVEDVEPSVAPKRKKKRRGPPGIPASQIVGDDGIHPPSKASHLSRESSPETTLASAAAASSPTQRARPRSTQHSTSGSSSESDAPLSTLVARRSVSNSKPKRTPPRVPRGFSRTSHSVQDTNNIEKTLTEDSAADTPQTLLTGSKDVDMQQASDLIMQSALSASPVSMLEPQASSSGHRIPPHSYGTREEGGLEVSKANKPMALEDGEVTPITPATMSGDVDPLQFGPLAGSSVFEQNNVADGGADQDIPRPPSPSVQRNTLFNDSMTVLAFVRGTSRGRSVSLSFELDIRQAAMVKNWAQRHNTTDDGTAEYRCLSLACHPYAECSSILPDLPSDSINASKLFDKEPLRWPLRAHPHVTFKDCHDLGNVLPVTPLSIDCNNLLDVSLRAHEGLNAFEITGIYGDTADYVFVLHFHPPTSHQLEELEKCRAGDSAWKQFLVSLTVVHVPQTSTFVNLQAGIAYEPPPHGH